MESNLKNVDRAGEETEEVGIYDECGDTMWDRVLAQQDLAVVLKPEKEKD